MHDIQKIILKRLFDKNIQKYADLTRGYSHEENIVFHLKKLADNGLIKKENNSYIITTNGVKKLTKYDLSNLKDTGFKTFFIGLLCKYENQYLVKSHPHGKKDFYNLQSGKPNFGEQIELSLIRCFKENAGLTLSSTEFSFLSLHLKTLKTSDREILFDDAFAIYKVELNKSQFQNAKPAKNVSWMDTNEINQLSNRWPEIDICILKKDYINYLAYEFTSDYIL